MEEYEYEEEFEYDEEFDNTDKYVDEQILKRIENEEKSVKDYIGFKVNKKLIQSETSYKEDNKFIIKYTMPQGIVVIIDTPKEILKKLQG